MGLGVNPFAGGNPLGNLLSPFGSNRSPRLQKLKGCPCQFSAFGVVPPGIFSRGNEAGLGPGFFVSATNFGSQHNQLLLMELPGFFLRTSGWFYFSYLFGKMWVRFSLRVPPLFFWEAQRRNPDGANWWSQVQPGTTAASQAANVGLDEAYHLSTRRRRFWVLFGIGWVGVGVSGGALDW